MRLTKHIAEDLGVESRTASFGVRQPSGAFVFSLWRWLRVFHNRATSRKCESARGLAQSKTLSALRRVLE